jgi:hypothetical protein
MVTVEPGVTAVPFFGDIFVTVFLFAMYLNSTMNPRSSRIFVAASFDRE